VKVMILLSDVRKHEGGYPTCSLFDADKATGERVEGARR